MLILYCLKTNNIQQNTVCSSIHQSSVYLCIYLFGYFQEHFPIFRCMIDYLQRNTLSKQCLTLPASKTDSNPQCSKLLLTDFIKL